jgi:NAD-dependent deacetylase
VSLWFKDSESKPLESTIMSEVQQLANWLSSSSQAIVFTGAGMSTESGIPDFRSPDGIWATSTPVYFDDFMASQEARLEYWRQKSVAHVEFSTSEPNRGHQVLGRWQQAGLIHRVVTQNIDGLHQLAGCQNVVELHGTARMVSCLECGFREESERPVREFLETGEVPCCPECQGITKHATISFGQQLDTLVLETAGELAEQTDLLLVMGSSLVVEPAASLPAIASRGGARVVIINRDPTDKDHLADLVVQGEIGATLALVDDCLTAD